jgi:DNA replication protein DnaC
VSRAKPVPAAGTLSEQAIRQYCRMLKMPTVASQSTQLAQAAVREGHSPVQYLEALLAAEIEERERRAVARRIHEARLPRVKAVREFDFGQSPAARIADLTAGGYIERAEPVVLIGEAGTGKTHLALGLCVAACQQRRVRFTGAAALVDELVEARADNQLSRALGADRADLHRRPRPRPSRRGRGRTAVPGHRRPG